MKYNIFGIMIIVAFILYTFEYEPFMVLGTIFLAIGAYPFIKYADEYEDAGEENEFCEEVESEFEENDYNEYIA